MNRLILQSTSLAQWYTLVNEAQVTCGKRLAIDLESYLVYLLESYTNKPELTVSILSLEYLKSLETTGKIRAERLRDVGDKCLLFSGFFPDLAIKRNVTVSYFVELGRRAYTYLALLNKNGVLSSEFYTHLKEQFVSLLDLVFSMRDINGEKQALTLLQAEELWRNARSQYAFNLLKKHNKNAITPIQTTLTQVH